MNPITRAAQLLREHAQQIFEASTVPGDPTDWCGDIDGQALHGELLEVAAALDQLAESSVRVPSEPNAAITRLLTGYDLNDHGLSNRDRGEIEARARKYWQNLLVAANSPSTLAAGKAAGHA